MIVKCVHDKLVKIKDLKTNPRNPNSHPQVQVERLAKLIEYQGQRHPIIVSNQSGLIVAGHGRLEAIKLLGWEKVAVSYQDFEDEAQEYAFMVSDNAIAEWADLILAEINLEILNLGPELDIEMLGLKDFSIEPLDKYEEPQEEKKEKKEKAQVVINFKFKQDARTLHDELTSRGYNSKIIE
jgi:hypothetical protein